MITDVAKFPMRINKYLAYKNYCTRREADALIAAGKVLINGHRAKLGDQVGEADNVDVHFRTKQFRYFAYNKPRGVITHSPQLGEKEIRQATSLTGVFPVGRLDKDSHGLIILTDDGRITDKLLNPDYEHEKEYVVTVKENLAANFKLRVEKGVHIEGPDRAGYTTKPCQVKILGEKKFSITLTEGKKHQIRRMCAALGYVTSDLERTRIMNIKISGLKPGEHRALKGTELASFMQSLGLA